MDMMELRRQIALNEPHIVTTAPAGIANFSTDLIAPLKSCKVEFSPVQSGSGDPSPSNIRPISGWTGCNVWRAGKNLFDASSVVRRNGHLLNDAGQEQSTSSSGYTLSKTPVNPGNIYTLSGTIIKGTETYRIYFYNGSTFLSRTSSIAIWYHPYTFTVPSGCNCIALQYQLVTVDFDTIQLVEKSSTIPIDWTTEAGTVYGGYVDLVTGELVAEYENKILNGSESGWGTYSNTTNGDTFWIAQSGKKIEELSSICDSYTNIALCYGGSGKNKYGIFCDHEKLNRWYFRAPDSNVTTLEEWKTWLFQNNLSIVYKIATPITYQLTPTQLKSLRGVNNIWSDANGDTTVKYWAH